MNDVGRNLSAKYESCYNVGQQREEKAMKYNMLSSEIRIMGRTIPGERIPLFWTASGIETIFEGNDLFLEYESEYAVYEDWIRVEMPARSTSTTR